VNAGRKSSLPADSLIGRGHPGAGSRCQIDEINHDLVTAQAARKLVFVNLGSYDDNLTASNHLFKVSGKQRTNMGNNFLDILSIRASEPTQRDVSIPYPQLAAFPQ
jgi:hypothetical protein